MKHRIRERDGKVFVVIEDGGKVLDEREMPDVGSALALRDRAFVEGGDKLPSDEPKKKRKAP